MSVVSVAHRKSQGHVHKKRVSMVMAFHLTVSVVSTEVPRDEAGRRWATGVDLSAQE